GGVADPVVEQDGDVRVLELGRGRLAPQVGVPEVVVPAGLLQFVQRGLQVGGSRCRKRLTRLEGREVRVDELPKSRGKSHPRATGAAAEAAGRARDVAQDYRGRFAGR